MHFVYNMHIKCRFWYWILNFLVLKKYGKVWNLMFSLEYEPCIRCGRCTRVMTSSTRFSNMVWGRSTKRLHNVYMLYTPYYRVYKVYSCNRVCFCQKHVFCQFQLFAIRCMRPTPCITRCRRFTRFHVHDLHECSTVYMNIRLDSQYTVPHWMPGNGSNHTSNR